MHWWLALVAIGGCYAPHAPTGAPCDSPNTICPSDQICVSEASGHFCESGGGNSIDATTQLIYQATVAECVDPTLPNPDKCKMIKGSDQLCIDMLDATTNHPWDALIRFDLDDMLAGHTVTSVKLELTATSDSNAPSGNSGSVWQVMAFALADLSVAEPAKVGSSPLDASQGNVSNLEVIHWTIPNTLVAASGSVYLGMTTTSQDGVNYWNLTGPNPPRLVIDVQ